MATTTRYLSSERFVTTMEDGRRQQYEPRLKGLPLLLGSRISALIPGQTQPRLTENGGVIQFALDEGIWDWLQVDQHYKGQEFRVYLADPGDKHADLELVYRGRVEDLVHDTVTATLRTATAEIDLDNNLVDDLYGDDDPEELRGRPKPRLYGEGRCLAPVLYDPATLLYHLSTASGAPALAEVTELRVGGDPWIQVDSYPDEAQYAVDLSAGTIQLGGQTLGGEVRCDARAVGYDSLTTAGLVRLLVEAKGLSVSEAAMTALDAVAPYLIGYYTTTDPVNRLNALDEIMSGVFGYWGVDDLGVITAGAFALPAINPSRSLTSLGIVSLTKSGDIPPAWRIQVEYARNWQPQQTFFGDDATIEELKQRWGQGGIIAPEWSHDTIKDSEPRAVDVPLVRSLVQTEADATDITNRMAAVLGEPRHLYDVTARTPVPRTFDTIAVDYKMVRGNFRALAAQRAYGAGASVLQVYGAPLLPSQTVREQQTISTFYLLTEDGGYLLIEDGGRIELG